MTSQVDQAPAARVTRVTGPLVEVTGLSGAAMYDIVEVGAARLPGEVVAIRGVTATVQAYEYTGGVAPGDPARGRGAPLSASLGPHLLGGVFDGLLRPLSGAGAWLDPARPPTASAEEFEFTPSVGDGDTVAEGAELGTVSNPGQVPYRVVAPPGVGGIARDVRPAGPADAGAVIAVVGGTDVPLTASWPVRVPRPYRERLAGELPLRTGQRVIDMLFPVSRGGTAAVPGGFGTGKTVLLQQITKWCEADVIVYVGCGERGNELADMLAELAGLADPRTGGMLAQRTVVIANTSNMPMMAREASIYSAACVAEHFRDMGLDVVVVADSTSRWAEALREFASRSGELPAEEGYPASLASALAAFYERAGRVITSSGREGSITIIGAVSPAGGDMTEPVTTYTQRFVRCLWTLDRDLAYARHYPAVSWAGSFSRDAAAIGGWYARNGDPGWSQRRSRLAALLADADRLGELAELMGVAALPPGQRVAILAGRIVREGVLQQSALSRLDATCAPDRAAALADAALAVADRCQELADRGVPPAAIEEQDFAALLRAKDEAATPREVRGRQDQMLARLDALAARPAGPPPPGPGAREERGGAGMTTWAQPEYTDVAEVRGPLLVVRGVHGVGWDEFATIRMAGTAPVRHGLVLEADGDLAVVQVLEGTAGLNPAATRVEFSGSPMRIPVGPDWLGRVCNGRGEPADGGPPVGGDETAPVAGFPINPAAREPPAEPVLTGVSAIDALTTLVRGQKLPIFSVAGLPHLELAAQVAAQASAGGEPFSVIFAAMGLTYADAAAVRGLLEDRSAAGELVLLLNLADAPVIERILTPRVALTVAEDLAFRLGRHVLVVMADMTSYCEALREVSAARGEIPARRAYPGYLYSDLASLYERCGRIRERAGSLTLVPVLTMPAGDITHPVPDLTGYITEGQVVLSPELHARGIYPPVDELASLSRLMRQGAGHGRTRADHLDVAAQTLAALASARRARELAELIGSGALSESDRRYLNLERAFENDLENQGRGENRSLEETLRRAWRVLGTLPRRELAMLPAEALDAYYPDGDAAAPGRAAGPSPPASAAGGAQREPAEADR